MNMIKRIKSKITKLYIYEWFALVELPEDYTYEMAYNLSKALQENNIPAYLICSRINRKLKDGIFWGESIEDYEEGDHRYGLKILGLYNRFKPFKVWDQVGVILNGIDFRPMIAVKGKIVRE